MEASRRPQEGDLTPHDRTPVDIQVSHSASLPTSERDEILSLCRVAYDEDLDAYLEAIGPGEHLLGRVDGRLVSHVMLVSRALQPEGYPPLRTGYVELVATHPSVQGRGYASTLMRALPARMDGFQLGGLSPSDPAFYARLGWEEWTGPLAVRTERGLEPTPDEGLMVLRLPQSPPALDLSRRISIEWREGEIW